MKTNFDSVIRAAEAEGLELINIKAFPQGVTLEFFRADQVMPYESLSEAVRRYAESLTRHELEVFVGSLSALAGTQPASPAEGRQE